MKKLLFFMMAVAMMFALTACGGNNEAAPASNNSAAPAGEAKEVKLVASNFQFDQAEYTVAKGDTVNFVLENSEGVHGIEIKGLNVKLDNSTKNQTITVDEAGEYEIICNIPCGPGHLQMKSKLIVQ